MTATDLTDSLRTLVDLPSETGAEQAIADFVHQRLRARGGGEILRSGHSTVWRGPQRGRPLVVLAGHVDTVPENAGNGRASVRDGNLYGLGSSDMKSGVAVQLALHDALDFDTARFDIAQVFYDAEEGPAVRNGLGRVLNEMPWLREARLAVLLEPTDLKVELGCNGILNAQVRVTGKSAHSARPWMGVNAIERAAPWLTEITRFPVTPVTVGGAEFRETLQVTTLTAGRARNVVPDELVANLNYRFPPDRSLADAERKIASLVPAEFTCEIVDKAAPGRVCSDEPEVAEFIARFRLETAGKQGWTDVARFTEAGIPAFNYGPGLPEQAHQRDEYCPIDNLLPAFETLRAFLMGAE